MQNFQLCVFIVSNALLLLMQKGKRDRCLHHFKRSKVCSEREGIRNLSANIPTLLIITGRLQVYLQVNFAFSYTGTAQKLHRQVL